MRLHSSLIFILLTACSIMRINSFVVVSTGNDAVSFIYVSSSRSSGVMLPELLVDSSDLSAGPFVLKKILYAPSERSRPVSTHVLLNVYRHSPAPIGSYLQMKITKLGLSWSYCTPRNSCETSICD